MTGNSTKHKRIWKHARTNKGRCRTPSARVRGFKSYAKRTVVQGFDQQFNAITGLNGSGKSSILDERLKLWLRAHNLGRTIYGTQPGARRACCSSRPCSSNSWLRAAPRINALVCLRLPPAFGSNATHFHLSQPDPGSASWAARERDTGRGDGRHSGARWTPVSRR